MNFNININKLQCAFFNEKSFMIVTIWHIKKNVHLLMQFWKNITFAALYMIVEHIVGIYKITTNTTGITYITECTNVIL